MKSCHLILIFWVCFFSNTFAYAKPAYREGYLLVQYKADANTQLNIASLHKKAKTKKEKKFANLEGLELVKLQEGQSIEEALKIYENDENILYAEPNYLVHATVMPDDAFFAQQWAFNNLGQTGGFWDADINGPEAWEIEKGKPDVAIAIIDTGVDYNHEDLKNNMWINKGEIANNGIDDDNNGYIDDIHGINALTHSGNPFDDQKHGTHVAGIIGAEGNNELGVSGIMQKTSMVACKFLDKNGEGDVAAAVACIDYVVSLKTRNEHKVNIVAANNSWAGSSFSKSLFTAIKSMQDAGILFIAAASNEKKNNDISSTYPANYTLSNVISVAATDHKDNLAIYSNYGQYSVHVAAPGEKILSTYPNNRYGINSGTSMAAPFVSGLAGLLASANPDLNWIQIKNLIIAGGQITDGTMEKVISNRRIRAFDVTGEGSLSCQNQRVFSLLTPKNTSQAIRVNQTLTLTLLSLNCAEAYHSANVQVASKDKPSPQINFVDDGTRGDLIANDGIFTGRFVPTKAGTFQIKFSKTDIITVKVKK